MSAISGYLERHGLPTIAQVVALIAAVTGVYKYLDTRAREVKRPFLEKQMALYFDVCKVVATLARRDVETTERKKATERFWELYWGELSLVESGSVEVIMVALGRVIELPPKVLEGKDGRDLLERLSYQLAHACRASIGKGWGFRPLPLGTALFEWVLARAGSDIPDRVFDQSTFDPELRKLAKESQTGVGARARRPTARRPTARRGARGGDNGG